MQRSLFRAQRALRGSFCSRKTNLCTFYPRRDYNFSTRTDVSRVFRKMRGSFEKCGQLFRPCRCSPLRTKRFVSARQPNSPSASTTSSFFEAGFDRPVLTVYAGLLLAGRKGLPARERIDHRDRVLQRLFSSVYVVVFPLNVFSSSKVKLGPSDSSKFVVRLTFIVMS